MRTAQTAVADASGFWRTALISGETEGSRLLAAEGSKLFWTGGRNASNSPGVDEGTAPSKSPTVGGRGVKDVVWDVSGISRANVVGRTGSGNSVDRSGDWSNFEDKAICGTYIVRVCYGRTPEYLLWPLHHAHLHHICLLSDILTLSIVIWTSGERADFRNELNERGMICDVFHSPGTTPSVPSNSHDPATGTNVTI